MFQHILRNGYWKPPVGGRVKYPSSPNLLHINITTESICVLMMVFVRDDCKWWFKDFGGHPGFTTSRLKHQKRLQDVLRGWRGTIFLQEYLSYISISVDFQYFNLGLQYIYIPIFLSYIASTITFLYCFINLLLYWFVALSLYCFLYCFISLMLYLFIALSLYSNISVFQYLFIQISLNSNISAFQYLCIPISLHSSISVFQYI